MSAVARAGFWVRWSFRDLRQRWGLVITLALVVALATGVGAGLGSMEQWRTRSNDASFSLLHMHDLRLSLTAESTVEQGALAAAASAIADRVIELSSGRIVSDGAPSGGRADISELHW